MNDIASSRAARVADTALPAHPEIRHPVAARPSPPRHTLGAGLLACLGVFIVIAVLGFSSFNLGVLLALGSFGSTAVMMFTFPEIHFSQRRSVVAGHVICTAVGLAALNWLGPSWWSLALAAAASCALMMMARALHPPAGSNPIIVFLLGPKWSFLLFPTLFGALTMVAVAVLYHRACRRHYPAYWY